MLFINQWLTFDLKPSRNKIFINNTLYSAVVLFMFLIVAQIYKLIKKHVFGIPLATNQATSLRSPMMCHL